MILRLKESLLAEFNNKVEKVEAMIALEEKKAELVADENVNKLKMLQRSLDELRRDKEQLEIKIKNRKAQEEELEGRHENIDGEIADLEEKFRVEQIKLNAVR